MFQSSLSGSRTLFRVSLPVGFLLFGGSPVCASRGALPRLFPLARLGKKRVRRNRVSSERERKPRIGERPQQSLPVFPCLRRETPAQTESLSHFVCVVTRCRGTWSEKMERQMRLSDKEEPRKGKKRCRSSESVREWRRPIFVEFRVAQSRR